MKKILIICLSLLLSGCVRTVYVPQACPKPPIIAVPVDYMATLKQGDTPAQFVRACLATRESYKTAYNSCTNILRGYQ